MVGQAYEYLAAPTPVPQLSSPGLTGSSSPQPLGPAARVLTKDALRLPKCSNANFPLQSYKNTPHSTF